MKPVSISDHENFHRDLDALHGLLRPHDFDDIDEAVADPITEKPIQRRSERDARRVLSILDELDQKGRAG
jgi:hypothetical protein